MTQSAAGTLTERYGAATIKDSSHAQGESNAMSNVKGKRCLLSDNVCTEFLSNLLIHFKGLLQDKCIRVKDSNIIAPVCQKHDGHHTDEEGRTRWLKVYFTIQLLQALFTKSWRRWY